MDHIPEAGSVQERKLASRWLWLYLLAGLCAIALAGVPILSARQDTRILMVKDALDPMAGLIASLAGDSLTQIEPYALGQQVPGHGGMSFLFGSQAWPVGQTGSSFTYVPLYSATIVIAVNNRGNSVGKISEIGRAHV